MRDWPGASEGDVLLGGHPRVRAFAPGRCELAGNHMDHQGGVVLSATVSDGITGIAAGNDRAVVRVLSDGYDRVEIALDDAGLWRKTSSRGT